VREAFAEGNFQALAHPLGKGCPPTEALRALSGFQNVVPTLEYCSKVSVSCQLALLWAAAGFTEAAAQMAGRLEPLIAEGFTALWTPEREYSHEETALSTGLLLRALGRGDMAEPKEGFFRWLYHKNLNIDSVSNQHGYELFKNPNFSLALTLKGHAGAIRVGNTMIPAFGPHAAPLSNPNLFGVADAFSQNRWFCSSAVKESWFQIDSIQGSSFGLHSIGATPIYFAFYVRAGECRIREKLFKPKSLQRFQGEADSVQFDGAEISVDRPLMTELIPLAGGDSFWGATFLLAFKLPTINSKIFFKFK